MTPKDSKLPRILEEGIQAFVLQGVESIAQEIIEEQAAEYKERLLEKIKQDLGNRTGVVLKSYLSEDSSAVKVDINLTVDMVGISCD